MSKKLLKEMDVIIDKVNNITQAQLNSIDLKYLKTKRVGNFLIIIGIFDAVFLAKLNEVTSYFDRLQFPNVVFKCYSVLAINITNSKYALHRLYSFPINLDLYSRKRHSSDIGSVYLDMVKQIEDGAMELNMKNSYSINSEHFRCTQPISLLSSSRYHIDVEIDRTMYFDIDNYVNNYITITGNNIALSDNFYNYPILTKENIVNQMSCTCVDKLEDLEFACTTCKTFDDRNNCSRHHAKLCQCGKYTYYRDNNCVKCHVTHSKSKYIKEIFENDRFNVGYVRNFRNISNYIPYFHYNQNSGGICLGSGSNVINHMVQQEINPIKLMLSFKANLAYTDAEETYSYYLMYNQRLKNKHIEKHVEFYSQLSNVFRNKMNVNKRHIFSIRCFCPQCFYYRVCLHREDIKLDPLLT